MLVLAMRSWAPAALLSVVVLAYALLYDVQLQSEFHLLPVLIVAYVAAQRDLIGAIAGALSSLAAGLALSTGWLHPSGLRSEEHTSELQSLMRSSSAVFCLKKTNK